MKQPGISAGSIQKPCKNWPPPYFFLSNTDSMTIDILVHQIGTTHKFIILRSTIWAWYCNTLLILPRVPFHSFYRHYSMNCRGDGYYRIIHPAPIFFSIAFVIKPVFLFLQLDFVSKEHLRGILLSLIVLVPP